MFSESHCHLRHLPYDYVGPTVKRAEKAGVELALIAGVDVWSSHQEILTAKRFNILRTCIGIHPWNADLCNEETLGKLKGLASDEKVVAISEIGLDYRGRRDRETARMGVEPLDKQIQRNAFRAQLKLAKELDLPVIIHDNTPEQEVLDILEEEGNAKIGAAIHGFDKDLAYAKRCMKMGVYISIGLTTLAPEAGANLSTSQLLSKWFGTAPTSQSGSMAVSEIKRETLKDVIRQIDLKWLLTDSDRDCFDIVVVASEKIAEIKSLSRDEVGSVTTNNLKRLVRL